MPDWTPPTSLPNSAPKVYVAGPYSIGDTAKHINRAYEAAEQLVEAGYAPYVPHGTHFWHLFSPKPAEYWYELDLVFLEVCDAVLRLPGESRGADNECERARELGMPVYTSVEEIDKQESQ